MSECSLDDPHGSVRGLNAAINIVEQKYVAHQC